MYICIYVYRLHIFVATSDFQSIFPCYIFSFFLSFSHSFTHTLFHSLFLEMRFLSGSVVVNGLCTYTRTINIYDVAVVENIHDWLLLQLYSLLRGTTCSVIQMISLNVTPATRRLLLLHVRVFLLLLHHVCVACICRLLFLSLTLLLILGVYI